MNEASTSKASTRVTDGAEEVLMEAVGGNEPVKPDGAWNVCKNGGSGVVSKRCCCPFACICFPCAMQVQQAGHCTPDFFTWFSETGCFAAQTVWRKDKTIDYGFSTCLAALVCTPCYLAYLLDNKKVAQVVPAPDADASPLRPVDGQPGMIRF